MDSEAAFSAQIDVRNDVANVALSGALDLATVPVLEERLARLEGDGVRAIMLDLRDLSFLDCSGLGAFVSARERANRNGHRLVLIGAGASARRLVRVTGTEFPFAEQDPAMALDQFTHSQPDQVSQPMAADVNAHAI